MKIVTVKIEDNSEKINNIRELKNIKYNTEKNIISKIDETQKEGFMQILAYIKCITEDYLSITGKSPYHRLSVSTSSHSVMVYSDCNHVFVDFDYSRTLQCKDAPPRMEASFINDNIIITKSTREGICDLMNYWEYIKPEFQKKIDKAYEEGKRSIKKDIDEMQYMLNVAEKFKV